MTSKLYNKTCTVLGAGGFIGRHLVSELMSIGAIVRVFGRKLDVFDNMPVDQKIESDFSETSNIELAVKGADIVFHLVNSTSPATAESNRLFDIRTNLEATIAFLSACLNANVERIIFASSGGTVYGPTDQIYIDETVVPRPISSYGITKLAIEKYLFLFNHLYGMRNISLRISNPYGEFQLGRKNQGVIGTFMRAAYLKEEIKIFGNQSVRDYIYVKDVASSFIAAGLYDGPKDLFNIGTGVGRSLESVIIDIESLTGNVFQKQVQPARVFDVGRSVLDISAAKEHLDWAPKSEWPESLKKTWDWVRTDPK